MISLRFFFRPSSRGDTHRGSIYLRIISNRRSGSMVTPYRLYPSEWDEKRRCVRLDDTDSNRFFYLQQIKKAMKEDLDFLRRKISQYEDRSLLTVKDLFSLYRERLPEKGFVSFCRRLSVELLDAGRERTARGYRTVVNGLVSFTGKSEISFRELDSTLLKEFEQCMRKKGRSLNTISFYMRNLRAIYNKAVVRQFISKNFSDPFTEVYTGVQVTRKRALNKMEMQKLENLLENPDKPLQKPVTDSLQLFLFCFHARGMSYVDMAYLKKENIQNGILRYERKKTGQTLEMKITPAMRKIIRYFVEATLDSPYLFPVIRNCRENKRRQYESGLRLQNKRLKRLARQAGISKNISTHVARHSWATIAKNENLPLWVISESLGHSSQKTTYTYLASFERSILDKANEKVANAVKKAV